MTTTTRNRWRVEHVDPAIVERLTATHTPSARAVEAGVDIFGSPQREDNDGYNYALLREARCAADVIPGSVVSLGSTIGTYLAKVLAWDFEVSDDDPMIVLDLLPVSPADVQKALARYTAR